MTMTMPVTHSPKSRAQLRILIVEDHMLFAESLELVLSVEGYDVRRIPVPDNSGSPGTMLSSLVRLRPRIVLLDLDLGRFGDGDFAFAAALAAHEQPHVPRVGTGATHVASLQAAQLGGAQPAVAEHTQQRVVALAAR